MKNREAQLVKNAIDTALICLSHALEEPADAESYIHIAMDELECCARYVHQRQDAIYYTREINDDEAELE